ncbi:CheF family chemotaxis protein [Halosimplex litoreum]|uniref:Taxis protein CheF n=1 Tax=Halosimplex litoreum TaxID=1198301 RepID=A0A7T3FYV9_9EURY|nr:CheF family chemotaxis protein [Halosimplex litoreum]QPV63191.1 CheF family chemotaxis protein [Halosimplex litoreum]
MSNSEKKVTDMQGRYMQPVAEGRQRDDAGWQSCRIVLTTERLVLVADGKLTVPLAEIDEIGERYDVNQRAAGVASYLGLTVGDDVVLVSGADHDEFETDFYHACLNGEVLFVDHPAVEGGVVQGTDWTKARIRITDDDIRLALADGERVVIERDDIGEVEEDERQAAGEQRRVIEVEHSQGEISVETHITGGEYDLSVLWQVLEEGVERNRADLDLGPVEEQVVMALHSGVSPFEIPDFVDSEVEDIEAIYDRLIELDVIEVVRERTEVEMTARGRSVAGERMGEQ